MSNITYAPNKSASVTPSLARGLTKRFIREHRQSISESSKIFTSLKKTVKSRKGWDRLINLSKSTMKDFSLASFEKPSKRHPVYCNTILTYDEIDQLSSWNQKVFGGISLVSQFSTNYFEDFEALFLITQHTVSRIFLRTEALKSESFSEARNFVHNELRTVPGLSSIWLSFFYNYLEHIPDPEMNCLLTPMIPTEHGLLLCQLTNSHPVRLQINTFISDRQLSEEQRTLKISLMDLARQLQDSAACFYPIIFASGIEESMTPYLMLFASAVSDNRDLYSQHIFERIQDRNIKRELQHKFCEEICIYKNALHELALKG